MATNAGWVGTNLKIKYEISVKNASPTKPGTIEATNQIQTDELGIESCAREKMPKMGISIVNAINGVLYPQSLRRAPLIVGRSADNDDARLPDLRC